MLCWLGVLSGKGDRPAIRISSRAPEMSGSASAQPDLLGYKPEETTNTFEIWRLRVFGIERSGVNKV